MKTIKEFGQSYPLVEANNNGQVHCPFCSYIHDHGSTRDTSKRYPDCYESNLRVSINGKWHMANDGYYVKFKPK